MLGLAGLPLGLELPVPRPVAGCPGGEVGELVVGSFDDPAALARLAAGADVVTYEFENVSVDAAAPCSRHCPRCASLELGQDRLVEKELFRRLGIPTARFGTLEETGLPAIVKTRRLGYDGKGQRRIETELPVGERRAGRGARLLRSRAVDRRGARARR